MKSKCWGNQSQPHPHEEVCRDGGKEGGQQAPLVEQVAAGLHTEGFQRVLRHLQAAECKAVHL